VPNIDGSDDLSSQMNPQAERELDTNLDTVLGHNYDAPSARGEENSKMEGEDFHEHQSFEASVGEVMDVEEPHQESDCEQWVPTEAEKDAASRLRDMTSSALPRPVIAAKGVKRPRTPTPVDDSVPDLAEIFDNYDTPHSVRISVCRAYASYIASLQPKKPKAAPRKRN